MADKRPRLSLVVAAAENGVIGKLNSLPWRLPSELKLFRKRTMGHPVIMGRRTFESMGHPVIMGRRTFESIGKPLTGRDNIVVTRGEIADHPDVLTANSIEEAVALAERLAARRGVDEIFVIGGSQIFDALRDEADRIYFTRVHVEAEGDRFFAEPEPSRWREIERQEYKAQEGDSADYTVITYERIR